jgi:hypothetical protein
MPKYTRKVQVLFTEEQYRDLLEIAEQAHKPLGTLLREAAEQVYLQKKRAHDKKQAVKELLSLKETKVPEDYEVWERQYMEAKYADHGKA